MFTVISADTVPHSLPRVLRRTLRRVEFVEAKAHETFGWGRTQGFVFRFRSVPGGDVVLSYFDLDHCGNGAARTADILNAMLALPGEVREQAPQPGLHMGMACMSEGYDIEPPSGMSPGELADWLNDQAAAGVGHFRMVSGVLDDGWRFDFTRRRDRSALEVVIFEPGEDRPEEHQHELVPLLIQLNAQYRPRQSSPPAAAR